MINHFIDYIKKFLEQPHPDFDNLPICPFIKTARLNNKIMFQIQDLRSSLSSIIAMFLTSSYEVLIILHIDDKITCEEVETIAQELSKSYPELVFFDGHPNNNHKIKETYTRREPIANIVIQRRELLKEKSLSLQKTNYFNNFNEIPNY